MNWPVWGPRGYIAHKILGGSQMGVDYITLFVLLNSSKVATPKLGFVLIFESLTQAGVRALS